VIEVGGEKVTSYAICHIVLEMNVTLTPFKPKGNSKLNDKKDGYYGEIGSIGCRA